MVFDYLMKFSGWKIPFPPPASFLRFDFTGIPIFLSLAIYGLPSGAATSVIAFLAIVVRSGKPVSAAMKALGEFSTVLGAAPFIDRPGLSWKVLSLICSLGVRAAAMSLMNIIVLPMYYQMPLAVVLDLLPFIALFNGMQGALSFFGGYSLYELLRARIPSLVPRREAERQE